jgi:ribosomal protein S16
LSSDLDSRLAAAIRRYVFDDLQTELQRLEDLQILPEEFYSHARARADLRFRPFANALADESVRAEASHQAATQLFSQRLLKAMEAKRVSEIEGLGKRKKIDQERVATWISEGRSVANVCREILDQIAKPKPIATQANEQRQGSECKPKPIERPARRVGVQSHRCRGG